MSASTRSSPLWNSFTRESLLRLGFFNADLCGKALCDDVSLKIPSAEFVGVGCFGSLLRGVLTTKNTKSTKGEVEWVVAGLCYVVFFDGIKQY